MKNIIIIIFVLNIFQCYGADLDIKTKEKIEKIQNDGEIITSREILNDLIDENNLLDGIDFWIKLDERYLNTLDSEQKSKLTKFCDDSLTLLEKYSELSYYTTEVAVFPPPEPPTFQKDKLEKCHFNLISINTAKIKIDQYDQLKTSVIKLINNIKRYMNLYINNDNVFEKLRTYLKWAKSLKQQIKRDRTNYISYVIVSPYLAETDRKIKLAKADSFLLLGSVCDEQQLKEAVKILAKGVHKDILLQAKEDVREQFYEVYSELKDTAGDKEWDDLKVLQTLVDTMSREKKTGADSWWQ